MTRSRRTRSSLWLLVLIWLLGAGLWALPQPYADALRALVFDAASPGQHALLAARDRWESFHTRDDAEQQLVRLTADRDLWRRRSLHRQAQSAVLLQQVADARRGALSPFDSSSAPPLIVPQLVAARVLGNERSPLPQVVGRFLDRGRLDGVAFDDLVLDADRTHVDLGTTFDLAADMPVYAGRRVVGRIRQAGRWTSTLQLLTDREYRGFAQLVRESAQGPVFGAEGVLAGNGDGTCRLELIADTAPVSIGDYVYTVARQSLLPEPLCYGRIIEVTLAAGAPHWTITVAPAIADERFDTVQVLRALPNPTRWGGHSNHSETASVVRGRLAVATDNEQRTTDN